MNPANPTLDTEPASAPAASAPRASAAPARTRVRQRGGPVRVALVGAGYIADFHAQILREMPGVEIVAVCDASAARARDLADRFRIPAATTDLDDLPGAGVEVAHLLVPPDLHVPLARRLLAHGIGAFIEKPLALESGAARDLVREAAERGLPLGVNHNNLHHPAFTRLLDRVRAGEIGPVEHVQITYSMPLPQLAAGQAGHWMFQKPRNIVFEQAPHPVCQVHALVGRVRSCRTTILGSRELSPGQTFHDRWLIAAEAERGTAEIYLSFAGTFPRSTIQVLCADGSAEADLLHNALALERKTLWLDFWNSFLAGWRRGKAHRRDAGRGLGRFLRATLGLSGRQDTFFIGMRRSVRSFYADLDRPGRRAAAATAAVEVLEWCEAITDDVPGREAAPVPWPEAGPPRDGEICLLGATGFIGRRVVRRLVEAGRPVTLVTRRAHSLPREVRVGLEAGRVRLLRGSLEDGEAMARALTRAGSVLQLATGAGETWEQIERSMVGGSVAAARAARAAGAGRFVYVSSIAALYTVSDGRGDVEDSPEADPRPSRRAEYSRGKIAAEQALLELHRREGLPLVIARPGVVLGEGTPMQHSGFGFWVRDNHCIGWDRGDHPLPLVWVDDVADALVAMLLHPGEELHGRALNLCARPGLSAREAVEELRRVTGRDLHFHPRATALSQGIEIGKWAIKMVGRRPGAAFPSWRDLKARGLDVQFTSRLAREVLGWRPVEDREAFLDRTIRIYAPPGASPRS